MILQNPLDFSTAFIFIICVGGVFCLNEHIEDIITDPSAVYCSGNPCMNNGTCYVVSLPGTSNANSEVECTGELCFKYVFEALTWHEASEACTTKGGELASFNTSEKMDLLTKSSHNGELHYNCPTSGVLQRLFWTSGNQNSDEVWMWENHEPIEPALATSLNESGIGTRGACLEAAAKAQDCTDLEWIPANCTQEASYICELHQSIILEERTYQCRCDSDHYGVNCNFTYPKEELNQNRTCESETMELACPTGMVISIDHVLYGISTITPRKDQCPNRLNETGSETSCAGSQNATLLVSELCHGRNMCSFTVNQETLGNISCIYSLPENKDYYAQVAYFCKDKNAVETYYGRAVSCGYDKDLVDPVYIACYYGRVIDIQYAYFGHMDKQKRDAYCRNAESDFFKDDYKDDCSSSYFLEYLVKRCNGNPICAFFKDHVLLRYRCEDPPPITSEDRRVFVDVRYICLSEEKTTPSVPTTSTYSTSQWSTCTSTDEEGIDWPETNPGVTSEQSCPDGQSGLVTWMCKTDGMWHEDGPDNSLCVDQWIEERNKDIEESDTDAKDIANEINEDFASTENINVETVSQIVDLMDSLINLQEKQLTNVSEEEQTDVVVEFQTELLTLASDLLQDDILLVFENGQENEAAKTGTSVSGKVEESAFLLADTLTSESKEIKSENIDMKVRAVDIDGGDNADEDNDDHYTLTLENDGDAANECSYLKLPRLTAEQTTTLLAMTAGPEEAELYTVEDAHSDPTSGYHLEKTAETTESNPTKSKLKMMFVKYKTLGKFLDSNLNDEDSIATETYTGNGTEWVESTTPMDETTTILNSDVIGASLRFGDHAVTEFEPGQTVQFCLMIRNTSLIGGRKCVYWSYSERNTSEWLSDGCSTEDMGEYIICTCNHTTNFAILMDVQGVIIPSVHETALRYITIIGCSISIVALLLCIFAFSVLRRLRSLRTTIHRNLCISLAASQFIFIVGIERTENKVVCSVIAGVLHYFFLVSFMWMCLEGIHLYITLVRVFNAENHGSLHYYLAAYALPLLVVVALAGSVPEGYGTEKHCWLSTENNFILAFIAPVAAIILINLIILVVALRKAYTSSKAIIQEATKTRQLRTWVKGAITLLFLLGSTWATGLLFFSESSVFMAYIFTILNSLQGFFIFVFYCFKNDAVRKEAKRWLSRKSWVPKKTRDRLKETPKTTSMGNTLSTNVNHIEETRKIDDSATITCRYSDDYTISSLLTPANIDMVDFTRTGDFSSYTIQGNITTSGTPITN